MGLRIGVLGAGSFATRFIPLFKAHPAVEAVYLAEALPERRREQAERFGVGATFEGLDDLLGSDCDAVAIFTQRWLHGAQAVRALRAGKHVWMAARYCAPGIVAHESVRREGQLMEIPDFGDAP